MPYHSPAWLLERIESDVFDIALKVLLLSMLHALLSNPDQI